MNLERTTKDDPRDEIRMEMDLTIQEYCNAFNGAINARTGFDFKEALDALGREKSIYSACVQDLVSLGENYPVLHNQLNYLDIRN